MKLKEIMTSNVEVIDPMTHCKPRPRKCGTAT
jgi:hypothetical protein